MENILANLIATATAEHAVAIQKLTNQMTMIAYPTNRGMIVGLGYGGEHAHRAPAERVVRKRSGNLARYGAWLPVMFNDGGVYVTMRAAARTASGQPTISSADLAAAQELIS